MVNNKALNLAIKIDGKEVENTLKNLTSSMWKLRREVNKNEEGTEDWIKANKDLALIEAEVDRQRKAQKAFREEIIKTTNATEDQTAAMQDFLSSGSDAFSSLMSGDLIGFQEGMKGVAGGIKAATKAGLAFIATPIGAALALLTGAAVAAKSWLSYNSAVVEALRLTQQITGLSDQAADKARIRAETLTSTFGGDFKTNLEAARNLAIQFEMSYEDAFDMIERQLIRGQKNNDEFFQSMAEYSTFFAQAKFSADEFGKVIAAGYNLGFYSDKLPDAIKEADISLREQTTSTRDALVNAFGAPFSDDILRRIKIGETSTKDALQEISAKAQESNLDLQQNAQLTADVFRGAGEDAGGALKIFEALNVALNEQQRPLKESERILQEQVETTNELKAVSSALFATGDKGFGLLIDKAKLFGTKLLVDILHKGVDLINWFIELNNESKIFSGGMAVMASTATLTFEIISTLIRNAGKQFSGIGDIISGIFTLDTDQIHQGLLKTAAASGQVFKDIRDQGVQTFKTIGAAAFGAGGPKREKISLDSVISDTTSSSTNAGGISPGGDSNDPADDIDKKADQEARAEIQKREKVAAILKEWEAEREIQEQLEKFEKAQRAEEREILELEKKFEKMVEDAAGEKELLAQLEEEKQLQIQEIRDRYSEIQFEKDQEQKKKFAAEQQKFVDQLIDAEENLQNAKSEALTAGISTLRSFFGDAQGIYLALLALEKGLAINEIIVNASKAIALAQANHAAVPAFIGVVPNPVWALSAAATVKNIAATKLMAGVQIAGIAATALQGFSDGGPTDLFGMGFKDKSGHEVAGVVHTKEYVVPEVVRRDPEVPPILEYLERKRKKKLGLYAEGGEVATDTIAVSPTQPEKNGAASSRVEQLLETLIEVSSENRDILFGPEAELKRQEQQKKLDKIKNNSKVKKDVI